MPTLAAIDVLPEFAARSLEIETDDPGELIRTLEKRSLVLEEANRRLRLEVAHLKRLVYLDALTGLGNRRCFDAAVVAEIGRAARTDTPLTLLICDVDRFKDCNDTFGHDTGDVVLVEIAQELTAFMRRGGDLAVRYAGDEFALLLPGVSLETARGIADEIRAAVGALTIRHPRATRDNRVTVSIGGATFEAPSPCSPTQLVETADRALFRAKRGGRDRAEIVICG
jgi:two-component system chemotaxis family response regulator WspR